MRTHHGLVLALSLLLLPAAGLAQENGPAFPVRDVGYPGAFSLAGSLPGASLGFLRFADQPAAPGLAGSAYEARSRGLYPFIPARLAAGKANEFLVSPAGFGGLKEKTLFAGGDLRLGGVFRDQGGLASYFRMDLAASYSKGAEATGLDAAVAGGAGLLGKLFLLPCALSLSYDAVLSEYSVGEVSLEAGGKILGLGRLGILSAFGGAAFSTSFPVLGSSSAVATARGLLEAGRQDYRGAFAQGYEAWAGGEVYSLLGSSGWGYKASFGAEGALRFWHMAGIVASASLRTFSVDDSGWAGLLRGVTDSTASFSGDMGLIAKVELPVLFARGRLLKDDRLGVEFTIAPFVDAAFVRSAGTGLFEAGNLHCGAGVELAMGIDAERRDSFRVSGGVDLTDMLGGISTGDGSVELAAALCIAL